MIRRLLGAPRAWLRRREDAAWEDGYHTSDAEVEMFIAQKDGFIVDQSWIILGLVDVLNEADVWAYVPDDLHEKLRSYV